MYPSRLLEKTILSITFAITTLAVFSASSDKPNFVITIADDHGVYHSSVYGSREFQTPHLQKLADEGMTFDNAYVASPACAPSRAALFTGRMPYSNGIVGNHELKLKPEEVVIPARIYDTYESRVEMSRYIEGAERIDLRIGETKELIAKYLDPENTLVVYTSDHGMPWPFGKWSLYEAGIRTPFIAAWPGRIKANTRTDAMISWIDFIPTLIDLSGGALPAGIDGRSFAKVLFGETYEHRQIIFATHKGDNEKNVYPIRSVRVGNWKYILNLHPEFAYTTHTDVWATEDPPVEGHWKHAGHHWNSYVKAAESDPDAAAFLRDYHSSPAEELYRIDQDPFEENNLASSPEHSKKLGELRGLVAKRMEEVGDDKSLSGPPRLLENFQVLKSK